MLNWLSHLALPWQGILKGEWGWWAEAQWGQGTEELKKQEGAVGPRHKSHVCLLIGTTEVRLLPI